MSKREVVHKGWYSSFTIDGLDDALRNIAAYNTKTLIGLEESVRDAGVNIAGKARLAVNVRTGRLRRSIKSNFNRTKMQTTIQTKVPYAHLVELGAAATIIKPKKRKFLKIPSSSGNYFVSRPIHIPARPARPFMNPAYQSEKPKLEARVKKILQEV